ncbi:hypothetical protein ACP275_10G118200 [Erythranthe tilingii]
MSGLRLLDESSDELPGVNSDSDNFEVENSKNLDSRVARGRNLESGSTNFSKFGVVSEKLRAKECKGALFEKKKHNSGGLGTENCARKVVVTSALGGMMSQILGKRGRIGESESARSGRASRGAGSTRAGGSARSACPTRSDESTRASGSTRSSESGGSTRSGESTRKVVDHDVRMTSRGKGKERVMRV